MDGNLGRIERGAGRLFDETSALLGWVVERRIEHLGGAAVDAGIERGAGG